MFIFHLQCIIFINYLECSPFLLGADVNLKNGGGRTALHYAASKGRVKIAEILISHDAKINIKDKVVGCSMDTFDICVALRSSCPPFFITTLLR